MKNKVMFCDLFTGEWFISSIKTLRLFERVYNENFYSPIVHATKERDLYVYFRRFVHLPEISFDVLSAMFPINRDINFIEIKLLPVIIDESDSPAFSINLTMRKI